MGRKELNRNAVFALLSLNWSKKQIKKETGISERTYFRIHSQYEVMSQEAKDKIRRSAMKEEDAKANFEDYPFVKHWIDIMKSERIKSWNTRVKDCQAIWMLLQKKNPENWTVDDIKVRVIPELRKRRHSIFTMLVALRSLRPDLKAKVSTKREKPQVNIEWKKHFETLMKDGRAQLKVYLTSGDHEAQLIKNLHVTLGCREGSANFDLFKVGRCDEDKIGGLLGLRWEKVNWEKKTVDIYESKTGGGFYWLDCPIDLFGDTAFNLLREYWEAQGRPSEGRMFKGINGRATERLREVYVEVSALTGIDVTPHFGRKLHACLCQSMGIPLEIVAGDAPQGLVGVGWEDLSTLKKFYLAFESIKIEEARAKCKTLQI